MITDFSMFSMLLVGTFSDLVDFLVFTYFIVIFIPFLVHYFFCRLFCVCCFCHFFNSYVEINIRLYHWWWCVLFLHCFLSSVQGWMFLRSIISRMLLIFLFLLNLLPFLLNDFIDVVVFTNLSVISVILICSYSWSQCSQLFLFCCFLFYFCFIYRHCCYLI